MKKTRMAGSVFREHLVRKKTQMAGSVFWIRAGMLLTAVLFIGTGIARQEHLKVMQKAVKICLECIGIG